MATATPITRVYIAFNAGYTTPSGSRTWTEVTSYVEADEGLTITRGRSDELDDVEPSRLTLTLDNSDGRFSPTKTGGAYYPNVKKGRPIQVRVTYNSVTYDRFTGYIDDWPIAWPENIDTKSTVTITATSRLARLAKGTQLRSLVEEVFLQDAPVLFYPLTDGDDGTTTHTAANISTTGQPPLQKRIRGDAVPAELLFGAEDGPLTDGADVLVPNWAPPGANQGVMLRANGVTGLSGVTNIRLEGFFNVTSGENTRLQCMMTLGRWDTTAAGRAASGTGPFVKVWMDSGGVIQVDLYTGSGSVFNMNTSATTYDDGTLHYFLVQLSTGSGGANGTGLMRVDSTIWNSSTVPVFSLTFDYMTVGGDKKGTDLWVGSVSHCCVATTTLDLTRRTEHYKCGITGFDEEASGARITRLASFAGVPSAEVSTDTGDSTLVWQDTTGETALDCMRAVESTEGGVLFDGKDGTLLFYERSRRYTTTTNLFTLDFQTQDVGGDIAPTYDDQYVRNDVTVTRAETPTGATVETWRATSTSSIDDYGPYKESLESLAFTTGEVIDAAEWRVRKYGQPIVRMPTVTVDVMNADTSLGANLINCSIGDRFRLSNLPTQAPATTLDVFIEGLTETITYDTYTIAYYVTPASLSEVWVVQDATYGVYDTYPVAY